MYHDLREIYWWEGLKRFIAEFVAKCSNYKQIKAEHLKSCALVQEIQIHTWKWENINIDFVVCLPQTQKSHDSIWVIVDPITKSAHFIRMKLSYSAKDYARIFLDEIVCRHGIPLSIISDRGP